MEFGDHFSYLGGSFVLEPKNLKKALHISKNQLKIHKDRLQLWKDNPEHISFAHDMEWHGPETVDMLLKSHVQYEENMIIKLEAMAGSQLKLRI